MKTLIRNPGLAIILSISIFFLVSGVSLADTPKAEHTKALHTIPTLTGSIYKAGADTGNVGDTVFIPIYFGSAGNDVSEEFLMYWTWKSDSLDFLYTKTAGYHMPFGWSLSTTKVTQDLGVDTLKIRGVDNLGEPFTADSTQAMFALAFKVKCVPDSGGKTTVHWEPDIEANHHSHFHLVSPSRGGIEDCPGPRRRRRACRDRHPRPRGTRRQTQGPPWPHLPDHGRR